jgi:uncharacterized ferritin-like protein (DUF455 family)
MEIRDFAYRILFSDQLVQKLKLPDQPLTDDSPKPALRVVEPVRPENLQFALPKTAPSMPKEGAFIDPNKRAIAHHIMANHELQALEVMAFVLLAFPDAPTEYRRGMVGVMLDEQRHTRIHVERCKDLGIEFGDLPVNCYIWKKAQAYQSVLDYLAGLPLTFEGRNLDHSLEFEEYFLDVGDKKSAAIMRTIHNDEIEHVRFGITWFRKFKSPDDTDWDAYCNHLHWPIRPKVSKGDTFHRSPRLAAGLSEDFVDHLESTTE